MMIGVAGCSVNSAASIAPANAAMLMDLKGNEDNVSLEIIETNILVFGKNTIKNWSTSTPNCDPCSFEIEREFHPLGPTVTLKLSSLTDTNTVTIIDSPLPFFRFSNAKFSYNDAGELLFDQNNLTVKLEAGMTVPVNQCNLFVHWSRFEASENNLLYSDDKPKHRTQLILHCP